MQPIRTALARQHSTFTADRFFVLRTPALSFSHFLEWGRLVREVGRADAHAFLAAIVSQPAVREALFLASPDLERDLDVWFSSPDSERGARIAQAVIRYFSRMCWRPTPFGLFAAVSHGKVADTSRLSMRDARSVRVTRLDMQLLCAIAQQLERDRDVRSHLRYSPNTSLYQYGDRLRYSKGDDGSHGRMYHVTSLQIDAALSTVLAFTSQRAALPAEIALQLQSPDITHEEAIEFVHELIDAQVLISELDVAVTHDDQLARYISVLEKCAAAHTSVSVLRDVHSALAAFDSRSVPAAPHEYRLVVDRIRSLGVSVDEKLAFQSDLGASATLTLGKNVVTDLQCAAALIYHVNSYDNIRWDAFARVMEERYEQQPVPLTDVLDPDQGILDAWEVELSRMMSRRLFERQDGTRARDAYLIRLIEAAALRGDIEVALSDADLEVLAGDRQDELPDAYSMLVSIDAASPESLERGDYRLIFHTMSGPSGADWIGRFCHLSRELRGQVETHLRSEERLSPDDIFAEIVHVSTGRLGNIISRPSLRPFEIP